MSDTAIAQAPERNNRARIVLGIVLGLLVLLLLGLSVFFVRLLAPARGVLEDVADNSGLVWVRSMYGFGPSEDEQLRDPTSVACAPDGRIYVSDPQRARVMIFNADGTFDALLHTGAGGFGPKQFARPESIDIDDDGNVYIADSYSQKVIVFDENGEYVREWQVATADDDTARGVYVNGNDVYVLTSGKLSLYDRNGKLVGSFGSRGRAEGQMDTHQGVVSANRQIFVADALNSRVQAFDPSGKVLWMMPNTAVEESSSVSSSRPYQLPMDLTVDGKGRLVAVDAFSFEIVVSDPKSGKVIKRYGRDGSAEGQFFYPTGIDYDPQRDWFAVADTRNNRVQIVRLPDSGGNAMSALRRVLLSPYRYCALPIALMIVAAIIGIVAARRRRDNEDGDLQPV